MRIVPSFVSALRSRAQGRASTAGVLLGSAVCSAALAATVVIGDVAHASGPVERLVQVLLSPSDPNVVVVRWGVASEGYLFSKDGGHVFKAMCSVAINPGVDDQAKIKRLSNQAIPSAAATLIDTHGKLLLGQTTGLWSDDGTGCAWTKQLDGLWPYSLKLDPKTADEVIAVVTKSNNTSMTAETRLMRRDASGKWDDFASAGALIKPADKQRAYGGDLIASKTSSGTQLYASVQLSQGDLTTAKQRQVLVGSSDGGKTWTAPVDSPPTASGESFILLAIDPLEPKRILAAVYRDSQQDTLKISEDSGATFKDYQQLQETSGVAFDATGRVFISDSGDATGTGMDAASAGGLWTAAKLGDPLTLTPGTSLLDCVQYEPTSKMLLVCKRDAFGTLDPATGAFTQRVNLNHVPALLDCPGVDLVATCKDQLNQGPSWCCAGHYPYTPFCGQYDVTSFNGTNVYCGVSGAAFDTSIGRVPPDVGVGARVDAGAPGTTLDAGRNVRDAASESDAKVVSQRDAGEAEKAPPKGDGCSIAVQRESQPSTGAVLASLGILLTVLTRSLRSRRSRLRAY